MYKFLNFKHLFQKKDFNQVLHNFVNGKTIDYGIILGSDHVVLIKTGLGGTIYGYKNKYLKIATDLNKKYGYTVICATTPTDPFDGFDPLPDAMQVINEHVGEKTTIYFMGHSCGALVGALYGYKYPRIQRMLLVNAPLMVDTLLIEKGLNKFEGEKAVLVYGALDRSVKYIRTLEWIKNKNVSQVIIPKADHNFVGQLKAFNDLFEKYLLANLSIDGV